MLELPKSLPALQRSLQGLLEQTQDWHQRVEQYTLSDDLRCMADLFRACLLAAIACIDDDAIAAQDAIYRVLPRAEQWLTVIDGRSIGTNFVRDVYGGIHDDEMNAIYETTTAVLEDLKDWEYTTASVRATGYLNDEYIGYQSEDSILLYRMQALADCCEAVLPIYWEQKRVVQPKLQVVWHQIQAWKALVVTGTSQY
jgi:hypothetical protein